MPRPVTPALLRELLRYERGTGKLYWLPRTPEHFSHTLDPDLCCRRWNTAHAGEEAMPGASASHGYCAGALFDRQFLKHRVIWALVTGEWPTDEIDHIDGDRTNNRFANLRSVPREINMRNRKLDCDNRSGAIGVYWARHAGKWRAEIKGEGKRIHLGYFTDKAAAIAARKAAEPALGFHPNHGRAA